ncbi:MAG: exodeoxyribonuclease-3 [Alphaproteobacteria bacterium]|jgi:exodeoxyribonuclease-3
MKVVSWNLNSIRARLEHVENWIKEHNPDVLCLQETKVRDDQFPHEVFEKMGLNVYTHGQPAYNGVALISPHKLEDIERGFPEGDMNDQKRVISCTLNGVRIINVYIPQGDNPDSPKYEMKGEFYKRLRSWVEEKYTPEDDVLICGDFNIAPADIDVHDAEKCSKKCGYLPEEVTWLEKLMDWGFDDSYRIFNPETEQFSWWDYRMNSYKRNRGMRIDHVLTSKALTAKAVEVGVEESPRALERPSDHVPVFTVFKV